MHLTTKRELSSSNKNVLVSISLKNDHDPTRLPYNWALMAIFLNPQQILCNTQKKYHMRSQISIPGNTKIPDSTNRLPATICILMEIG